MDEVGRDLFTPNLQSTLHQFREADNFGSLIRPDETNVDSFLKRLEENNIAGNLFLFKTHQKVLRILEQTDYLNPKYHVVIANPPYMGTKGVNGRLGAWLKDNFSDVKSDLFSAFILRCSLLCMKFGHIGIMSPNVWMYILTYEKLRGELTRQKTLTNLVELPLTGFKGATVQICAFNFNNAFSPKLVGSFIRLVDFKGGDEEMASRTREAINKTNCGWHYRASSTDFMQIPGTPIAYWVSSKAREAFSFLPLSEKATFRAGLQTGDNDTFLRYWYEVGKVKFFPECPSRDDSVRTGAKWFPHNKGGGFRKWHGNKEYVINWENDGADIKERKLNDLREGKITANNSKCWNQDFYFKNGLTWTSLSSAVFSIRDNGFGFLFDTKGQMLFPNNETSKKNLLALLNSKVSYYFLAVLS